MNRMQAAEQFRRALQMFAASLDEENALIVASIYPEWNGNNMPYKNGEWVKYGVDDMGDCRLYQVLQDHNSQAEYTPEVATSLYKRVGISEDGTAMWIQPAGATDAYNTGDIVMYNGVKYISAIDNNVWSPDVYGWDVYEENMKNDEIIESDIADFVQPTAAHDAYKKGDKVRYNGAIYESIVDNNIYAPNVYPDGWKEINE